MKCQHCGNELLEGAKFCSQCGKPVAEKLICPECGYEGEAGMIFCIHCGTRLTPGGKVQPEPKRIKVCPKCGRQGEEHMAFCQYCGVRLVEQTDQEEPQPEPIPQPIPRPEPKPVPEEPQEKASGQLLKTLKSMSMYKGEPTVGVAQATGELRIYDDHIEYTKKLGNAVGGMFGAVGMAVAASKAKKESPVEYFWFIQISEVHEGRYGGIFHTLVITDHSYQKHSFAGMASAADIQQAVALIQRYLR